MGKPNGAMPLPASSIDGMSTSPHSPSQPLSEMDHLLVD